MAKKRKLRAIEINTTIYVSETDKYGKALIDAAKNNALPDKIKNVFMPREAHEKVYDVEVEVNIY